MAKHYLTSCWKYYFSLSGPAIFWFFLGIIAYHGKDFDFLLLMTPLGLIGTALAIYDAHTMHIIVSETGIELYSLGFNFWINWNLITKISHRLYGVSVQEGLIVEKLMIRFRKWQFVNLPNPFGQIPRVKPLIPLSCFSENWRDSELGQQIKQYAPHLFVQNQANS